MAPTYGCAALMAALLLGCARAQGVEECLRRDSIACLQEALFRGAKQFFGQDSVELAAGVSLVRSRADRSAREADLEREVEQARGVAERQDALEGFLGEEIGNFLAGRSLKVSAISGLSGRLIEAVLAFLSVGLMTMLIDCLLFW